MTAPRLRFLAILALGFVLCVSGPTARAGFIDAINPNATSPNQTLFGNVVYGIGWYYTPTQSYTLTGISSDFEGNPNFSSASQTLTVQIQTDRPAAGGTLLAQGSFVGVPSTGGILGSTFSSGVSLVAGTTYFVDFLGVGGMGVDLGQYVDAGNGIHTPSAGATTRLAGSYVADSIDATFPSSDARPGNAGDSNPGNGNDSFAEPILFFSGTPLASAAVPEPSSVLMVAIGLGGAAIAARRRKK